MSNKSSANCSAHYRPSRSEAKMGLYFFLPAFIVLCVFLLWPCLQVVLFSFTKMNLLQPDQMGRIVGFRNYLSLYQNSDFWISGYRSLIFTVASTLISILLSYLIASFVNFEFKGKSLVYVGLFLPWVISDVVTAFVFRWNFDMNFGIINYILVDLLHLLHEPVSWLGSPHTALPAVIFATIWRFMPFSTLVIIAALKQVSGDLTEAAKLDGASLWKMHTHVIIPAIKAPLVVLFILRVGALFRSFDLIWLLTKGGPGDATNVLPILYYRTAFQGMDLGMATTVAVHIFLFVLIIYLGIFKLFGREAFTE